MIYRSMFSRDRSVKAKIRQTDRQTEEISRFFFREIVVETGLRRREMNYAARRSFVRYNSYKKIRVSSSVCCLSNIDENRLVFFHVPFCLVQTNFWPRTSSEKSSQSINTCAISFV